MSLIKQAEELEFVPKQQLIQMAQNPRGDYPPFLVISEIERRNRNEKSFKAQQAKANMPTTTVAEESVMEFAGRGIAPSEPMLMAGGGITQMQAGGALGTGGDSLAASFNPFGQQPEEDEDGIFRKAIDFAKENPAQALSYASNALLFVPGLGVLGAGALKVGAKLLPRVVQAAKSAGQKAFTKPNPAFMRGPQGKGSFTMGGPERTFSLARTATVGLPAIGATKLGVEALAGNETETNTGEVRTGGGGTGGGGTGGGGTGGGIIINTTDTDDKDRFLTLAQLGGVIGAARNPSELSAGLGQLASNIQQQRRGEDMRQAELQLKQAQIAQVQSAIENLPIEQLNETYNAIIEGINAGQLDAEEYGPTLNSIVQRLMALQSIDIEQGDTYKQFVSNA